MHLISYGFEMGNAYAKYIKTASWDIKYISYIEI